MPFVISKDVENTMSHLGQLKSTEIHLYEDTLTMEIMFQMNGWAL